MARVLTPDFETREFGASGIEDSTVEAIKKILHEENGNFALNIHDKILKLDPNKVWVYTPDGIGKENMKLFRDKGQGDIIVQNFDISAGLDDIFNKDGTLKIGEREFGLMQELCVRNAGANMCHSPYITLLQNTLFKRRSAPINYHDGVLNNNSKFTTFFFNFLELYCENNLYWWSMGIPMDLAENLGLKDYATELQDPAKLREFAATFQEAQRVQVAQNLNDYEPTAGAKRNNYEAANAKGINLQGDLAAGRGRGVPVDFYEDPAHARDVYVGAEVDIQFWINEKGVNIFYLLNALFNLNVMGTKISSKTFVIENVLDWITDFNYRFKLSDEDANEININKKKHTIKWIDVVINLINSNKEIFEHGHLDKKKEEKFDFFSGYMDTSSDIFNVDLIGPNSEYARFVLPGLTMGRTIFSNYYDNFVEPNGRLQDPYFRGHYGFPMGGGSKNINELNLDHLKIGKVSYNEMVKAAKGSVEHSYLIGGSTVQVNTKFTSHEGALLLAKIEDYYNFIKSVYLSKNRKLSEELQSGIKTLIETIRVNIYSVESILNKMAVYANHGQNDVIYGEETETLESIMRGYTKTVQELRKNMKNFEATGKKILITELY